MSITNVDLDKLAQQLALPLLGIFSKDELPKARGKNGGYVFNLQDGTDEKGAPLPGTHWTAAFCEGKQCCYFDSFGFPPPIQVGDFLGRPLLWNAMQIQSIRSETCGYYCLYFIWWMTKHRHIPFVKRFQLFMMRFRDDPTKNLTLLKGYLKPL